MNGDGTETIRMHGIAFIWLECNQSCFLFFFYFLFLYSSLIKVQASQYGLFL